MRTQAEEERLEMAQQLQFYLDRLITLKREGQKVDREINEVLTKVNEIYRIGEPPTVNELLSNLREFHNAQSHLLITDSHNHVKLGNFDRSVQIKRVLHDGSEKTYDISTDCYVVVVPTTGEEFPSYIFD